MSGGPALSNTNSAGGASFRIDSVMFAATGFNTSSCSLLNGVVFLKIEGLSGDQKLASVTIDGQEIELENIYTHAGETTTVALDYPWLQGHKYHVTVTSQSQITVGADSPVTPVITQSNMTLKSIGLKGPSIRLTVQNNARCNAYLTQILVSGPNITNETNVPFSPVAVEPLTSSSLILLANFSPQNYATYHFTVIVAGKALTANAIAYPTTTGGLPIAKLT